MKRVHKERKTTKRKWCKRKRENRNGNVQEEMKRKGCKRKGKNQNGNGARRKENQRV